MLKNKKSEYLFPTQIAIADIENFKDFQDDLIKWIYEYKSKDSGISKISNKGGWQSLSKEVFLDEGFKPFQSMLVDSVTELLLEFNIQRENAEKHLAFGIGRHTCLGKPIALMQLNEFYSQFLKRFPDFEMNGEWKVAPNNFVHAIQEMPIKFTKE